MDSLNQKQGEKLQETKCSKNSKLTNTSPTNTNTTRPAQAGPTSPTASMGIIDHLQELRGRLIRYIIVWFVLFFICWSFDRELAQIILAPLNTALINSGESGKLITISLPEGFLAYLNVALVTALFLSSPYLFYQLWAFASPGLKHNEKKTVLPFALSSAALFCIGALFAYFVIFPVTFNFFINYAKEAASPEPSLRLYLGLALNMLLAFGFTFQLPLAILFLSKMGLVTPKKLVDKRKYAIVGAFILGAILTPPDPISQILMALPLIALYELSILMCKKIYKHKNIN